MIEVIVSSRCDGCQRCVEVCPANVFEIDTQGRPLIARQTDCESCYMCELYCKSDALYVGFNCEQPEGVSEEAALAGGTLGQYRRHSGWDEWAGHYKNEQWRMGLVFRLAGTEAATISGLNSDDTAPVATTSGQGVSLRPPG